MPLTGPQIGRIQNAILAAFDRNELQRVLLTSMNVDFDHVVAPGDFSAQVFALVRWANRKGYVLTLLKCAHEDVPDNATLTAVYDEAQTWAELHRGPVSAEVQPPTPAAPSAEVLALVARMQNYGLPATKRLQAGLRAADLGDLPPDLDAFIPIPGWNIRMGKYPVTNAQFKRFVDAGGYAPENRGRWWSAKGIEYKDQKRWTQPHFWDDSKFNRATQPVVGVTWWEAEAYCNWLDETRVSLRDDEYARLPRGFEWEAAARGGKPKPSDDAQDYPWRGAFKPELANTKESNLGQTTPVHMYPAGATPDGICDLAGNVWEWTLDRYEGVGAANAYWLKGGSRHLVAKKARASADIWLDVARYRGGNLGFRVVVVPFSRSS